MRIGIYHDVRSTALGGAAAVAAAAAEALASAHEVTILVTGHCPSLEAWQDHFGRDLSGVTLRAVPPGLPPSTWLPEGWFDSHSRATAGFDLVLASIHLPPPRNRSPRGVLYVHFPMTPRRATSARHTHGGLRQRVRRWRSDWAWHERFRKWQVVLGNSQFTGHYLKEWWGVSAEVLYPPICPPPPIRKKLPLILSVGRFAPGAGNKKQLEMMHAFARLPSTTEAWQYRSAGSVGSEPGQQRYLEAVRAAAPAGAWVHDDAPRAALDEWYATASIFWHAAGLAEPLTSPERMEHFGIVTAEAMAAGCVPVVHARGGQPEIVRHGVNGFLWETEAELLLRTAELQRNPALRNAMSAAAREAGSQFSFDAFRRRLLTLLSPLLS